MLFVVAVVADVISWEIRRCDRENCVPTKRKSGKIGRKLRRPDPFFSSNDLTKDKENSRPTNGSDFHKMLA
jgi:hypothetical protein